jgi:putative endonuclease
MTTRNKGNRGEAIAAHALRGAGYEIVGRNWRCANGELDLIARHRGELVFVEVRSRADGIEAALESISTRKSAKLQLLAQLYLAEHGLDEEPYRIDVVAVCISRDGSSVEIVENAVGW